MTTVASWLFLSLMWLPAVVAVASSSSTKSSAFLRCTAREFSSCKPAKCKLYKKSFRRTLRECVRKNEKKTLTCLGQATFECKGRSGAASGALCELMGEVGWKKSYITQQQCWRVKERCLGESKTKDVDLPRFMCKFTSAWPKRACNGLRSCVGNLPTRPSVQQRSCNGDYACYQNKIEGTEGTRFKIGKRSCGGYHACSYNYNGGTIIGTDSCNGNHSCRISKDGSIKIGNRACNKESSCEACQKDVPDGQQYCDTNFGAVTIAKNSCNGGLGNKDGTCQANKGSLDVGPGSCNGKMACSNNQGDAVIGPNSCNRGKRNCEECLKLVVGKNSCTGDNGFGSCQGSYTTYLTVGDGSCNGRVDGNACNGFYDYLNVTIGNRSCNGNLNCQFFGNNITIGNDASNGDEACRYCTKSVPEGQNFCD